MAFNTILLIILDYSEYKDKLLATDFHFWYQYLVFF
jgi:hypothetical protein